MTKKYLTLIAACVAVTSGVAVAQPAAKPEPRVVSREELRACMTTDQAIAARKKALIEKNAKLKEEQVAITADSAVLKEEGEKLADNNANMDRFNRKVRTHNQRIDAALNAGKAINAEAEAINKDAIAYNQTCTGIAFRPEDKEAILKEMPAAPKN
jgi:hypothetical protein